MQAHMSAKAITVIVP